MYFEKISSNKIPIDNVTFPLDNFNEVLAASTDPAFLRIRYILLLYQFPTFDKITIAKSATSENQII